MQPLSLVEIRGLASEALVESVRRVLTDLTRLIGYLNLVEPATPAAPASEQAGAILVTVHAETLVLVDYIEDHVLSLEGMSPVLYEALDSISFALKYELRRAAPHGPTMSVSPDTHDLLRNCFQQSFVMLARLFNPAIEASEVFDDLHTRHEQSLILWEDLIDLLQCVRQAETECSQRTIAYLIELLRQFRAGSMHYLMQKDWNPLEEFAQRVMACRRIEEVQPVLHQLECYLEILLNHVRNRAALSNEAT